MARTVGSIGMASQARTFSESGALVNVTRHLLPKSRPTARLRRSTKEHASGRSTPPPKSAAAALRYLTGPPLGLRLLMHPAEHLRAPADATRCPLAPRRPPTARE